MELEMVVKSPVESISEVGKETEYKIGGCGKMVLE